jgi:hypothetical protein
MVPSHVYVATRASSNLGKGGTLGGDDLHAERLAVVHAPRVLVAMLPPTRQRSAEERPDARR